MSINNNRMISGMGTKIAADGTGDLQQAFGSSQKSHAWFFSTAPIKPGAKFKPFNNTTVIFADQLSRDTAREGANYGLTIPKFTAASDLIDADWTLHRPDGTSYPRRALDFEKYYLDAPEVPACCTWPNDTLFVNMINDNATILVPFFVYQRTGYLRDCVPDAVNGCGAKDSGGRNETQRNACVVLSEINASGGAVITSLTEPYLGLAIFEGTTLRGFAGCPSQLVAEQTDNRDIDMYQLPGSVIKALGRMGDFTAMACIRYKRDAANYGYIPLPKGYSYRNKFSLTVGGADKYSYTRYGVAPNNAVSSDDTITTQSTSVYITIRVKNKSGIAHYTSPNTIGNWLLDVDVSGSAVKTAGGTATAISFSANNRPIANYSNNFSIANQGTIDLTFLVQHIWEPSGGSDTNTYSGQVHFDCTLKYVSGGTTQNFERETQQKFLTVNYG